MVQCVQYRVCHLWKTIDDINKHGAKIQPAVTPNEPTTGLRCVSTSPSI